MDPKKNLETVNSQVDDSVKVVRLATWLAGSQPEHFCEQGLLVNPPLYISPSLPLPFSRPPSRSLSPSPSNRSVWKGQLRGGRRDLRHDVGGGGGGGAQQSEFPVAGGLVLGGLPCRAQLPRRAGTLPATNFHLPPVRTTLVHSLPLRFLCTREFGFPSSGKPQKRTRPDTQPPPG